MFSRNNIPCSILAFVVMLQFVLLLGGCYKDRSTVATFELPELRVSGLDTAMHVLFGQEITVGVTALEDNRTEADFSYFWEIDFKAGYTDERLPIGEEKSITMKVNCTPDTRPYTLTCKVTDKQTGVFVMSHCNLYVQSSLGEGLLVAYTNNGTDYDIDLVANPAITFGYTESMPRYTRGLYSLVNDDMIKDKVLSMSAKYATNGGVYNDPMILIGTEKHLFRVSPLTFEKGDEDEALFTNVKESSFRTTGMWNYAGYSSIAIVNGNIYGNATHIDNVFSKVPIGVSPTDFVRPDNIAFGRADQGHLVAFNETTGKFYYAHGAFIPNTTMGELQENLGIDFVGAKCLGSGPAKGNAGGWLIKTKSGKYYIVYIYVNDSVWYAREVDLPEADNIKSVAFCDNVDIMFYSTDSELYAVSFGSSTASARKVSWTPSSADEKISFIRHYCQAWWGSMQYGSFNTYPYILPTNRTQLLIVTYNATTGEGKIYMRPFNLSTGMFNYKDNGTLEGFGEISEVAPTFI